MFFSIAIFLFDQIC